MVFKKPTVSINVEENSEDKVTIKVSVNHFWPFSKYYVAIDNNKDVSDETVYETYSKDNTYDLTNGVYYIHVKDSKGKALACDYSEVFYFSNETSLDYPFYPENDELDVGVKIIAINKDVLVTSSNEDVAEIIDNKIYTKEKGTTTISVSLDDYNTSFDIEVTDLYTTNNSDSSSKPYLHTTICSEEEGSKLDEVLAREIEEAGYGTRAGVVAAARFLALKFPYRITYFSESGNLSSGNRADGEGRYYHKGLYLTESKFTQLSTSVYGRATWGEYFIDNDTNNQSDDSIYLYGGLTTGDIGTDKYLSNRPNGLDCSGFVSWCYYNGGFDFGDLNAGGPGYGMGGLGECVSITNELLQSDRIKAGDLVGFVDHVGIVIGVEDDYIWIADTLVTGTKVTRYERNVESFNSLGDSSFTYFMLMDSEYIEDGSYTAMWD